MNCTICGKLTSKTTVGTDRKTCSKACLSKQLSLNGTKTAKKSIFKIGRRV